MPPIRSYWLHARLTPPSFVHPHPNPQLIQDPNPTSIDGDGGQTNIPVIPTSNFRFVPPVYRSRVPRTRKRTRSGSSSSNHESRKDGATTLTVDEQGLAPLSGLSEAVPKKKRKGNGKEGVEAKSPLDGAGPSGSNHIERETLCETDVPLAQDVKRESDTKREPDPAVNEPLPTTQSRRSSRIGRAGSNNGPPGHVPSPLAAKASTGAVAKEEKPVDDRITNSILPPPHLYTLDNNEADDEAEPIRPSLGQGSLTDSAKKSRTAKWVADLKSPTRSPSPRSPPPISPDIRPIRPLQPEVQANQTPHETQSAAPPENPPNAPPSELIFRGLAGTRPRAWFEGRKDEQHHRKMQDHILASVPYIKLRRPRVATRPERRIAARCVQELLNETVTLWYGDGCYGHPATVRYILDSCGNTSAVWLTSQINRMLQLIRTARPFYDLDGLFSEWLLCLADQMEARGTDALASGLHVPQNAAATLSDIAALFRELEPHGPTRKTNLDKLEQQIALLRSCPANALTHFLTRPRRSPPAVNESQ